MNKRFKKKLNKSIYRRNGGRSLGWKGFLFFVHTQTHTLYTHTHTIFKRKILIIILYRS